MLFDVIRKFSRTLNHAVDHYLAIEPGQLENAVFSQFIFKNRGHDRYDSHSPSSIPGALLNHDMRAAAAMRISVCRQ
jgi:hypothetical protein